MVVIDIDVTQVENSIGYAACFINTNINPIVGPYVMDKNMSHATQYAIYKCIEHLNTNNKNTRKIIIYMYDYEKSNFDLFNGPYENEIKKIIGKMEVQFISQSICDNSFKSPLPNRYNKVHKLAAENALVGKYMFVGLGKKKNKKNQCKINTEIDKFSELNKEIRESSESDTKIEISLPTKKRKKKKGLSVGT